MTSVLYGKLINSINANEPVGGILADSNADELLTALTEKAEKNQKTVLHSAASKGNSDAVNAITNKVLTEAPDLTPEVLLTSDNVRKTPLHWAVYANSVDSATKLMSTAETVKGLLKEVSLAQDDNGNTPFGASLYQEGKREVSKAILHQVLENGDVIVLVLTTANDYEISPLENIIILDDAPMFQEVMKKSSAQGVAKELLSFTNSEGKTVSQIAAVNNAHKIQAYIINSKIAPSVQAATKNLLKALESSAAKSQFAVVEKAILDANKNLKGA
jgi:ankyrin repeat protein